LLDHIVVPLLGRNCYSMVSQMSLLFYFIPGPMIDTWDLETSRAPSGRENKSSISTESTEVHCNYLWNEWMTQCQDGKPGFSPRLCHYFAAHPWTYTPLPLLKMGRTQSQTIASSCLPFYLDSRVYK
jgi:hypothetical protein